MTRYAASAFSVHLLRIDDRDALEPGDVSQSLPESDLVFVVLSIQFLDQR